MHSCSVLVLATAGSGSFLALLFRSRFVPSQSRPRTGLCLVTAWDLLDICSRPSGLLLRLGVDSLRVECEGLVQFFTIVVLVTADVARPMSAVLLQFLAPCIRPSNRPESFPYMLPYIV